MLFKDKIKDLLLSVAVGDALGVPFEYVSREKLALDPVIDMAGYGTYNLPAGSWSDDAALTFCLAEALSVDFDINRLANNFIAWYSNNYWTCDGEVFDMGITTERAIERLVDGISPLSSGDPDVTSNGNGALMRIAPLVFECFNKDMGNRFDLVQKVSGITHSHIRSVIACFYYIEFARGLIKGLDKFEIYKQLKNKITQFLLTKSVALEELIHFDRLLKGDINFFPENAIYSAGYVIDTLEASIWCLLTTENFKDCLLKAVNLGEDSDTTAAVAGGLAGLLYGKDAIPEQWLAKLKRKEDIENLAFRMGQRIEQKTETSLCPN